MGCPKNQSPGTEGEKLPQHVKFLGTFGEVELAA